MQVVFNWIIRISSATLLIAILCTIFYWSKLTTFLPFIFLSASALVTSTVSLQLYYTKYRWIILSLAIFTMICAIGVSFNQDIFIHFWNYITALHLVLIGISLYRRFQFNTSLLAKIILISVIVTTSFLTCLLLFKLTNPVYFTLAGILLSITTLLTITGAFIPLTHRSK